MIEYLEQGTVFQDRYVIIEKLSEGGFGVVYKARQLTTNQMVALKIMRWTPAPSEDKADQVYIDRFRRETQLCGELNHPNIVQLIDTGAAETSQLYTIFEYIPGNDLAHVLASEGALSPRETQHLMGQVLDALSAAHTRGIVHRDLKPANIMLVHTGARRNAKILDFGIAGLAPDSDNQDSMVITAPLERVGTPAYAAPEQLRGKPATARSDLYAWGLVYLECLTGQRAIQGASVPDTIYRQLDATPVPLPSALDGHPLGALLSLVTTKDVDRRAITADEALTALESLNSNDIQMSGPRPRRRPSTADGSPDAARSQRPGSGDDDTIVPSAVHAAHAPTRGRRGGDLSTEEIPPGERSDNDLATTGARAPAGTGDEAAVDDDQPTGIAMRASATLAPDSERRQITAVSFTFYVHAPSNSDLDIDEQAELLSDYKAVCREHIERAGGTIANTFGNRLLAFFGYPKARADDAQRAVRTGLAVRRALGEHGRSLERERGARLESHIGAHTGLVLVRSQERASGVGDSDVFGDTPVLAARVAELASPNHFAVSAATQRLVRHQFNFSLGKKRRVDELARPLEIFEVRGAVEHLSTPSPTLPGGSRSSISQSPLVGRAEELALVERQWHLAREGAGQAILVTGEAGIGKSRLTREIGLRIADDNHNWLEARCMSDGRHSSLRPVIELLERQLGYHMDLSDRKKSLRLEEMLSRYRIEPEEAMPLLAPLLSIPLERHYRPVDALPHQRRELTLRALLSLLMEIADSRPLMFVVEDLHWADPSSLTLLGMLLEEVPTAAVCMLLTARPSFELPWRHVSVGQIQLGRLGSASAAALITQVAGGHSLPAALQAQIEDRADGVPLFLEELTRSVIESDRVKKSGDGSYVLRGSIADVSVPSTLRDSLMARLDRLPPAIKSIAQLASVLGREFGLAQLAALSPMDEAELTEALDTLVDAELIYRRRRISGDAYLFKHSLVQETAYDSLPKRSRKRYHARIAEVFEERFTDWVRRRPEVLMKHYGEAGAVVNAVRYAAEAGRAALRRSANQEAIAYAERGLGWLSGLEDAELRASLELELNSIFTPAMMANYGFSSPEFRVLMRRAQEIGDGLDSGQGDPEHALQALWGMFGSHFARAEHETASDLAERYLEAANRVGDRGHRLNACTLLGINRYYLARYGESQRYLDRAAELFADDAGGPDGPNDQDSAASADSGSDSPDGANSGSDSPDSANSTKDSSDSPDAVDGAASATGGEPDRAPSAHDHDVQHSLLLFNYDPQCLALGYRSLMAWILGHPVQAYADADDALTRAEQLGHPLSIILTLFLRAKLDQREGDRAAVRATAHEIIALSTDKALPRWITVGTLLQSWADNDVTTGQDALARFEASGHKLRRTYWLTLLAEAELVTGALDDAFVRLDDCLYTAEESREQSHVTTALKLQGMCHARAGDRAAAEANLRASLRLSCDHGAVLPALQAATELARLLASPDQTDGPRLADARAALAPLLKNLDQGAKSPSVQRAQALYQALGANDD